MRRKKSDTPGAEVVALTAEELVATNRFFCETCRKGFQREQNLRLHLRGHNIPSELQRRAEGVAPARGRCVYVCPVEDCVYHDPARALGDITGIKKHFSRKHGEKRWECERCGRMYALDSDLRAHLKTCPGTQILRCPTCGEDFTR
ncbi:protein indeterminate-domain 13-like [Ananas comosus]|uniref:Protein indeterminate-domain 13-like n=1 Tax=Ananas comosus TaxID=4615 RepID=A0A6P5ETE1_ANACO|nr:protein indeterminate-domain 13-like [Ananas comosus]